MIGHGPDRGKILAKIHGMFSHMPDKDDTRTPEGGAGQVGMLGGKQGALPSTGNDSSAQVSAGVQPLAKSAFDPLDVHKNKGGRR